MNLPDLKHSLLNIKGISTLEHAYLSEKLLGIHLPKWSDISSLIQQRRSQYTSNQRKNLIQVLNEQYRGFAIPDALQKNLTLLRKEDTVTVCAAHQPILLGGPAFLLYKVMHTIKLAQYINETFEHTCVPVFWIGSEDHDIDELTQVRIRNEWFRLSVGAKKVGGVIPVQGIEAYSALFREISNTLPEGQQLIQLWNSIVENQSDNLSMHFRKLLHEVFGKYGLIILDGNHPVLKKSFTNVLWEDISTNSTEENVQINNETLKSQGYSIQAHAKPCNVFYIDQAQNRSYIQRINSESFTALNGEFQWNKNALNEELSLHPERFSPNVILRPLFQESVLPNIAFIGGGAEISYWIQLTALFEKHQIPYPLLVRRFSAAVCSPAILRKIDKLNLNIESLLSEGKGIQDTFIQSLSIFDISQYQKEINTIIQKLQTDIAVVDPTLQGAIASAGKEIEKQLTHIDTKIRKANLSKHELQLQMLQSVLDWLYPENSWQERKWSSMEVLGWMGKDGLEKMMETLDVTKPEFLILKPSASS